MAPLRLESFEDPLSDKADTAARGEDPARLMAWEEGYRAGWQDASEADASAEQQLRADLQQSLQGLALTCQEARSHILAELAPVFLAIAEKFLPQLAKASLAPLVAEELTALCRSASDLPVRLHLHPSARAAIEAVAFADAPLRFDFIEDSDLPPGQVWLRSGNGTEKGGLCLDPEAAMATVIEKFTLALAEASQPPPP